MIGLAHTCCKLQTDNNRNDAEKNNAFESLVAGICFSRSHNTQALILAPHRVKCKVYKMSTDIFFSLLNESGFFLNFLHFIDKHRVNFTL